MFYQNSIHPTKNEDRKIKQILQNKMCKELFEVYCVDQFFLLLLSVEKCDFEHSQAVLK